jgi:glycosyltransferase involved in cell wall biosynthesis
MRIAFVTTSLDPGGAETALTALTLGLSRLGARISVIALRGSGRLAERMRAGGIAVTTLDAKSTAAAALALPRIPLALRRFRPDVVQGWMYHGNLAATAAMPFCAGRLFWSIRQALGALDRETPATNRLIRFGARLSGYPEAIIYNSTRARRDHEDVGYSSVGGIVVPNGFDTERFAPDDGLARIRLRRQLGLKQDAIVVGHLARFHPVKDHATFLEAAALTDAPLRFLMAGRGVDSSNPELAELIERLELRNRVSLLGEADDTGAILRGLDVLCVSSRSEAFPNVLGEAMSCGVPCVTTDVGDAAQIVGGAGRVVPVADSVQLAAAISAIVQVGADARVRLGRVARQRIIEHYSLDSMITQYQRIYEGPGHRH